MSQSETRSDSREEARRARAAMPHDAMWPRAGGWPDLERPELEASDDAQACDAVLVGIGTHATSISDTSAHATPLAVRRALARFSPRAAGADLAALRISDAGDAIDPDGDEAAATALVGSAASSARLTIVLGGDNAATVPAALGAWGDRIATAGLITVDAHHDLRDGRSNGSPVRRLVEAGLDGSRIVQIGIQDFANSAEHAERAASLGITVVTRADCESSSMAEIAAAALAIAGSAGGPVHVDIDVDACDRAAVPGCPASVPGGLTALQLRELVRALARGASVTSIDFTEVDALADAADGRTVRLVAVCVLEALAGLASR